MRRMVSKRDWILILKTSIWIKYAINFPATITKSCRLYNLLRKIIYSAFGSENWKDQDCKAIYEEVLLDGGMYRVSHRVRAIMLT